MKRLTERYIDGLAKLPHGPGAIKQIADMGERLAAIEDILGDTYDLDRLREQVEADKAGRVLVVTDEMATAMRAGAYVLRDDDLAGAGLKWRPKSRKGEALYISYYKASDMLREAAESALAKEADHE